MKGERIENEMIKIVLNIIGEINCLRNGRILNLKVNLYIII